MLTPFAKNMIARRNEMGWTQEQAANAIGLTRAALGAYEEARSFPQEDKLLLIVKGYKIIDLVAFIYDKPANIPDTREMKIIRKYYSLIGREKEAVDILLGLK